MKRQIIVKLMLVAAASVCVLVSCNIEEPNFSASMLVGKWKRNSTITNGEDCYRYDAGGNGVAWDTGDDVTEAEGQPFTWTLNGATLELIHIGQMGERIPKVYTLKTLNESILSYKDDYGVSYTFSKFN